MVRSGVRDLTPLRLHPGCVAACAVLAWVAVSFATRGARACPNAALVIKLDGVPADGDEDVPTDVIPYYELVDRVEGTDALARFTITAKDGTAMLARFRAADETHYELAPDDPLRPNTQYVLRAEYVPTSFFNVAGSAEVRFTTGDGPLETRPAAPHARLIHYNLDRATDCLPSFGTCVSIGDDRAMVVMVVADDKDMLGTVGSRGSFFSPIDLPPTFLRCAQIRTRASNGTLSNPIMLCGSTVVSLEFHDTDRLECSSDGLKPLPPSPSFALAAHQTMAPDAGRPPTIAGPGARDAGTPPPDAQAGDAQAADAAALDAAAPLTGQAKDRHSGSSGCGCDVTQRSTLSPIAALLFALPWLRRRTNGR